MIYLFIIIIIDIKKIQALIIAQHIIQIVVAISMHACAATTSINSYRHVAKIQNVSKDEYEQLHV